MSKRSILIIGALVVAAFATTLAQAQSGKSTEVPKERDAQDSVQSDAERKAERRARNEAAAAERAKAGKTKAPVEEEEERRKKP